MKAINVHALDVLTSQYIHWLEHENDQLLRLLTIANTELEVRREAGELVNTFEDLVKFRNKHKARV